MTTRSYSFANECSFRASHPKPGHGQRFQPPIIPCTGGRSKMTGTHMAAAKQKTLLIVEDDEGMRDTLTAILRREYHLVTAPSGEAGLEALAKSHVDLMLLDVRLPGINGLDVLKLVKEQYPVVEVVVISAVSEVEIAVQAIKQGAYHFITKDFEYDALRSLVRN